MKTRGFRFPNPGFRNLRFGEFLYVYVLFSEPVLKEIPVFWSFACGDLP